MTTVPNRSNVTNLQDRPTDVDLLQFSDSARFQHFATNDYVWWTPAKERFCLSIRKTSNDDGQMEWQLVKGPEKSGESQWVFVTNDVTEVYTRIIKTTGEDLEEAIKRDLKVTRSRIKLPPNFYQDIAPILEHTFEGDKKVISNELEKLRQEQESALSGELSMVHITNVLQSVALAKISGRLSIDAKDKQVDIFFEGGAPVHAIGTMGDGKECILRSIGLQEGRFHFDMAIRTEQRTITESLESMILAGVKLQDNTRYLTELGLVNESILARQNRNLSEMEFEQLVGQNRPDMNALKSFYLIIDGTSSLRELVRRVGFQRSKWVEIVATLIRSNVIVIKQDLPELTHFRKELDPRIIRSFKSTLTNDQTRMFTYNAFLFMLLYEMHRTDEEHQLSLVLFELNSKDENKVLSPQLLDGIVWLINEIKRPIDILGHYEDSGMALLLPNMKSRAAAVFAQRIAERIGTDPRTRSVEIRNVSPAFGVASLPSDVDDVLSLLTAAEYARNEARKRKVPVVTAQEFAN